MNNEKKPFYEIIEEDAKLSISKGNSKMGKGIYGFSTLPGDKNHMLETQKLGLLTDIVGTCTGNCDGCFKHCYAVNMGKLHHNVCIKSWANNTLLLRNGKLWNEIDEYIKKQNKKTQKIKVFRINVSGEVQTFEEFEHWNEIAKQHPEISFGVYTKNYNELEKFMYRNGDSVDNLCINVSQWNHVADDFLKRFPGKFNVFEYDPTNRKDCEYSDEDKQRLNACKHCPAVGKDGHHVDGVTCDGCQRCYHKSGKVTAVWDH